MAIKRKKYKSRREKFEEDKRNLKLVIIFGLIASFVIAMMYRQKISDWFIVNFVG